MKYTIVLIHTQEDILQRRRRRKTKHMKLETLSWSLSLKKLESCTVPVSTTGMDPISRQHVWDIIEGAKRGRSIVLTTHSTEEADVLSDRIGIMAKGRLRCIGNSIRLKSWFGAGFVANVSFVGNANGTTTKEDVTHSSQHVDAVKDFFKYCLGVKPGEENKAFLTFVIPNEKESLLSDFFAKLQARQEEFGTADIQIGLTTLEKVFLNIAKQAELELAEVEHRLVTLTLATSAASVQIPVGARLWGFQEQNLQRILESR